MILSQVLYLEGSFYAKSQPSFGIFVEIQTLIHSSKVKSFRIAAFATVVSKFASSSESPQSANAILVASEPKSSMHYYRSMKLPDDLDIFIALIVTYPLQK